AAAFSCEHERAWLLAGAIVDRRQFSGRWIARVEVFEFGWHVPGESFNDALRVVLFWNRECCIVFDNVGQILVANVDAFGHEMIREHAGAFCALTTRFFAGLEPESHL